MHWGGEGVGLARGTMEGWQQRKTGWESCRLEILAFFS